MASRSPFGPAARMRWQVPSMLLPAPLRQLPLLMLLLLVPHSKDDDDDSRPRLRVLLPLLLLLLATTDAVLQLLLTSTPAPPPAPPPAPRWCQYQHGRLHHALRRASRQGCTSAPLVPAWSCAQARSYVAWSSCSHARIRHDLSPAAVGGPKQQLIEHSVVISSKFGRICYG